MFSTNGRKKKKHVHASIKNFNVHHSIVSGKKWVRASAESIEVSCFHHYQLELKPINP